MTPAELWAFLPYGYAFSVAVETPVLLAALSRRHSWRARLLAGFWLTACTYPIVVLVLPLLLADYPRAIYLAVAESFAPLAECVLFWVAFDSRLAADRRATLQDIAAIVVANLSSFLGGELVEALLSTPK